MKSNTDLTPETKDIDRAAVVAKFRSNLASQMETALDSFNADKIVREIVADAKRQQEQLVMRVIGLDTRYGGNWEVDHCNGRMSNITEFVNQTCGPMLREALAELIKDEVEDLRKKVRPKLKAAIVTELNNNWNRSIDTAAAEVVKSLAAQCAEEFKAGFFKDNESC